MDYDPGLYTTTPDVAATVTSSYLVPSASASTSTSIPSSLPSYSLPWPFYNTTTTILDKFIPSIARHIFFLPLRLIYRAEVFAFVTAPRYMVQLLGLDEAVNAMVDNVAGTARDGAAAAAAAGAPLEGMAGIAEEGTPWTLADTIQSLRRFSGFFSYMTSRWSLACFSVALILNRVTIYASTRRRISLQWDRRLALRILPVVLFAAQILSLSRAIRCQTSPEYPILRHGDPEKRLSLDHAGDGGFLYSLTSVFLRWETDEKSCRAVGMGPPTDESTIPYGSFSLLWPVFLRLCLSHFVETLSCALQGKPVVIEAGMSIFEHSLAFAEAETMISQSIGLGLFGLPKADASGDERAFPGVSSPSGQLLSRGQVLEKLNVTPELLLIALISCSNSFTSNLLDVFGRQSRYRLINTTIWGLCFMSAMVWGFFDSTSFGNETGFLKFPTVCIVGFVPHLLILLGIMTCTSIYCLGLFITAFSLPPELPQPTSLPERFALAHGNMQGATQIRNIRLNMHEDFYTALLRIGYAALTAASEAVFLNEGRSVVARKMTWLEEDRLSEIEMSRIGRSNPSHRRQIDQHPGSAVVGSESFNFELPERQVEWESGYGREKKVERLTSTSRSMQPHAAGLSGVGALQGATRCYQGFTFFRGIFFLLAKWLAVAVNKILDGVGITFRPRWFTKLVGSNRKPLVTNRRDQPPRLDFWILTDDGQLELPENNEFDVEKEMRKRELMNNSTWDATEESRFEGKLYNWWKAGGSWGDQDESGEYRPVEEDWDDTTSVVSMSTTADESEWEEYESDGRRTPTQKNPYTIPSYSRGTSPVRETILDAASLARLLDPRDKESKHEARVLASHLAAEDEGRVMTRSRFRSQVERERARILTTSRYHQNPLPDNMSTIAIPANDKKRPTPEEESEILENLILSRRSSRSDNPKEKNASWDNGASGLGPEGPQCVICQSMPRSIIAWPCRCLCICEDCRVSLAMNNFGSCVTCRREVGGFVRLWVP
ncbi:hypothetical protein FQN54_006687 [Arachnomyces sp. PD_36]|nr:hypothetical protein FQN54_006687 [Arachnomyces sp. PD_36]